MNFLLWNQLMYVSVVSSHYLKMLNLLVIRVAPIFLWLLMTDYLAIIEGLPFWLWAM